MTVISYGEVGSPEYRDTKRSHAMKLRRLLNLFDKSKYIVLHTGAGLSTCCGLADFRGPNGD